MHASDRELLDHFLRTREKTIELLDCIPEEWLSRMPPGESHPLYYLLAHTGSTGTHWWVCNLLKDGLEDRHIFPTEKDALRVEMQYWRERIMTFFTVDDGANLGRVFSYVDEEGVRREWSGRNRLLYFIDHEVHHRGKIVLALRQWGIERLPFFPFLG
ncbi:MAG: DinB family protein [Armatimonadota bacterium]